MEVKLVEIPVQILSLKRGDVLLLRVPADYTDEQRYYLAREIEEATKDVEWSVSIAFVPDNVSLAVVSENNDG